MNPNMTNEEWWQYLDTKPTGEPTEWINDICTAFRRNYIDYLLAWKALREYVEAAPEYSAQTWEAIRIIGKKEKQDDIARAINYKISLKEKGFSELQGDISIGDLKE